MTRRRQVPDEHCGDHRGARRRRGAHGQDRQPADPGRLPPPPGRAAVGVADLWLAGAAEDQARPRAALRRDHLPDHDDGDVHLHLRRCDRRQRGRVRAVADPRHLRADADHDHHVHRADAEPGHLQGCLRPVPLPAHLAARAAGRGAAGRPGALHPGRGDHPGRRVRDGVRPDGGAWGVLVAFALLLVFSFSLSWVWTVISLAVRTKQAAMGISMFILMPLTFASNIFVDPSTMPSWLEPVVDVNPVSVVVTSIRELMAGSFQATSVATVLLYCVVLVAVFGPISMFIYNRKS